MVYSIDSMHVNNGHKYPPQFMQIFSSTSCVQPVIITERLKQIYMYIVAYHWKDEILSFPTMCVSHSANLSLVSYSKDPVTIVARHVSKKIAVGIYNISPISNDRSMLLLS